MKLIGYAYFSKSSGTLVLADAKFKNLPHIFPIYAEEQDEDRIDQPEAD